MLRCTVPLRCGAVAKRMDPGWGGARGGELNVPAVVQGLLDLLALVQGGSRRACNSQCMVHLRRAKGAAQRPFQLLLVFSGWQFPPSILHIYPLVYSFVF